MIETSVSLSACYRSTYANYHCNFVEASSEQARSLITSNKVRPEKLIVQLSAKPSSRFTRIDSKSFVHAVREEIEWFNKQGVCFFVLTHLAYKSRSVNDINPSDFVDVLARLCNSVKLSMSACVYVEPFPESQYLDSFMAVSSACDDIRALHANESIDVVPVADLQRDIATSTRAAVSRIVLETDFIRVSRDLERKPFMPNRMEREISALEFVVEKAETNEFCGSLILAYDENNLRAPSNVGASRFINWCRAAQGSSLKTS